MSIVIVVACVQVIPVYSKNIIFSDRANRPLHDKNLAFYDQNNKAKTWVLSHLNYFIVAGKLDHR